MRILLFSILSFSFCNVFSQNSELTVFQSELNVFLAGLAASENDEERLLWNDSIHELLTNNISNPEIFSFDFQVQKMGVLKSSDEAFMLFNWNLPLDEGGSKFFCYVVLPSEDRNKVIELEQYSREPKKIETRFLDADSWYGALYYDIILVKKGKSTQYTLLGYSPGEKFITTKYIDVLTFKGDEVRLGAPVFKTEKGIKKRLIFKYSSEVSMTIRYQESSKRIIIDHLVPRMEGMQGNYEFYGPDGTFDAFNLNKDKWEFEESVAFRSEEKSEKTYKDPRNQNGRRN